MIIKILNENGHSKAQHEELPVFSAQERLYHIDETTGKIKLK
ncbi:MAG TPA: hypothetical protein VFU05_03250 [Cyclobacteriaceae bacterium]|nr:hypothetical protein [Cyclobacteriaceae bacterium]